MNEIITLGSGVGLGSFGQFQKRLPFSPYLFVPSRISTSLQANQAAAAIILFTKGAGGQRFGGPMGWYSIRSLSF